MDLRRGGGGGARETVESDWRVAIDNRGCRLIRGDGNGDGDGTRIGKEIKRKEIT